MKSIVQEASTIAKAVEQGWKLAGEPKDFSVKVLELPERNFFGFIKRSAKVAIVFNEAPAKQQKSYRDAPKTQPKKVEFTERPERNDRQDRTKQVREERPERRDRREQPDRHEQRQETRPAQRPLKPEPREQQRPNSDPMRDQVREQPAQPRQPQRELNDRVARPQKEERAEQPLRRESENKRQVEIRPTQKDFFVEEDDTTHNDPINITTDSVDNESPVAAKNVHKQSLWTEELVAHAHTWITDVLKIMGYENALFTIETSKFHLKIHFAHPILADATKEKYLYASIVTLMMAAIKKNFRKALRGHKIVITHS